VSTVLPTVIYELGLTGTAVAQLMTMVSSMFPVFFFFARFLLDLLTITNTSSPQPTYAFGCTCLMLIGYLIHRKYVSPWLAAISSTSNNLTIPRIVSICNAATPQRRSPS
jgi:hypothetical protein